MKRTIACSLLIVLAACGGAQSNPAATAAPRAGASPAQAARMAQPVAETADTKPAAAPTAPVESAALRAEPPKPVEPEIPVDDDPAQFMGAGEAGLRDILGDPALVRRDGPAEVWQFRGGDCTLDLFLYREVGGALSVKHVDLRGEPPEERRACLARMLRARIVAAEG